MQDKKIVLPGATKDALKALPEFNTAADRPLSGPPRSAEVAEVVSLIGDNHADSGASGEPGIRMPIWMRS